MQKAKSSVYVVKTPMSWQDSGSIKASLSADSMKSQDENKVCSNTTCIFVVDD